MKKIIAILSLVMALTSCELKNDNINLDQIFMSDLYGKWEIWSTESLNYSSIEFSTEGYYFIEVTKSSITDNQEVLYGKYSKTDDYQITLDGLGVIEITDYSDEKLYYDITLDGKATSETHKAKADDRNDEISDNTDTIGTLWSIYSYTYEAYLEQHDRETDIAYIYFSTSGTFISIDSSGDATSFEWVWSNTDETKIKVSNGSSYTNWELEGVSTFTVADLSNSDMKFEFEANVTHVTTEDETGAESSTDLTDIPFTMAFEKSSKIYL